MPWLSTILAKTRSATQEIVYPLQPPGLSPHAVARRRTWVIPSEPRGVEMMDPITDFCQRSSTSRASKLARVPDLGREVYGHATCAEGSIVLRLPLQGLASTLRQFLRAIVEHPFLAHLQLDFPFSLSSALLDAVVPIIKAILQQPSLHSARIPYLLEYDHPRNTVAFGAHSDADALALWTRLEALGELEVEVEVNVLDL